ncbi:MAG: RNA-binding S4 domain-containing protein [Gemmatimonadetes bacterium]|nr:MAG: RNA-binding S4 domain-containing protein [Gemmatimonadota bacterium]
MRLDLYLKKSRLIKERTLAKVACERGHVLVDGRPGKPAKPVKVGQRLEIHLRHKILEVEILEIPQGNVSKERARTLYKLLREEATA